MPRDDTQKHIRPVIQTREMRLEIEPSQTRADGTEDPRIPIALSSESAVERYDWGTGERYLEVLDHSPGAVDLTYARDGLPFLMDHNMRSQVGLIENVRVDPDRKLRGMVRMGNHPDAAWLEKDIRAGIRTKISVGYDPGDAYDLTRASEGAVPTRKYRGWIPMEGSSVAVPADLAAGVDRSAAPAAPVPQPQPAAGHKPEERTMAEEKDTPVAPPSGGGPSAAEQRERDLKTLTGYAKDFPEARDLLPSWLDRGVSPDQALREVQQKIRDAQKPVVTPPGFVDLPAKDERQYSIVRAINAAIGARSGAVDPWKDAGLEKEVSHTIANRSNRQTSGFFLPLNIGVDVTAARRLAERAAVTGNVAATASIGGAGVQTSIVGFIDLLRARTQVVSMGAQMLTGLTDTIQFTRQLAANNFNWAGENPTSANALSAATLESFTMAPKVGMSSTAYSKRLLAQFSFDVNAFVMNDLTAVNAIGVDQAALFGTGANEQPKGVRSVTGVTLQTVASNGAAASWADLVLSETNVANANADIGTMGWLVSPKVRGKWKTTLKSTTAGSLYLWSENNTVNGYRAEVTTQIPDNTTMGTSTTICSTPIFGVWSELLIGEWGGALDVVVDPYTYAQQNMIQIVTSLMVDVGVRHPAAFNVALGVLTS